MGGSSKKPVPTARTRLTIEMAARPKFNNYWTFLALDPSAKLFRGEHKPIFLLPAHFHSVISHPSPKIRFPAPDACQRTSHAAIAT